MTTPVETRPPALPIPGAFAVALTYDVSGQPAVIVLGVDDVATDPSQAATVATTFHNAARPLMATSCVLQDITIREAVPDGATIGAALPAVNARSGIAAGNLITAYATLVRWNTGRGGRSGRGRTFIPGFTTGNLQADGRTLSSTALTAAQALVTTMTTPGPGMQGFAVLSRRLGEANVVVSGSVSQIVGVQRRRLRN
jgi:hypothetical protein